jgi:hypothetical protein
MCYGKGYYKRGVVTKTARTLVTKIRMNLSKDEPVLLRSRIRLHLALVRRHKYRLRALLYIPYIV